MSNRTPHVKVYSGRLCAYCMAAKRLLEKKGIEYEDVMVDDNPTLRKEMERLSKQQTVPQIFIDEIHVGGYDDLAELHREGKLDDLLGIN